MRVEFRTNGWWWTQPDKTGLPARGSRRSENGKKFAQLNQNTEDNQRFHQIPGENLSRPQKDSLGVLN